MLNTDYSSDRVCACRICGGHSLVPLTAKEMMFGSRQHFPYLECRTCGCVQILEYPSNIEDHYPPNYYSYQDAQVPLSDKGGTVTRAILRAGKRALMHGSNTLRRRFLRSRSTQRWLSSRPVAEMFLKYVPDPDTKILDVGCGSGGLLRTLDALYYRNLHGVDPFIAENVQMNGRLLVKKAEISELSPHYDCISFHHVLEHMPRQLTVLRAARALLAPDGLVMVRIPVVGGAAWRTYRENWIQLDPPRHFYLHSEGSFRTLAQQAGFSVSSIEYDSTGFQFWGSELYLRGIPLMGTGRPEDFKDSVFSRDELGRFDAQAAALNQDRDGDQIVAILRPGKTEMTG